MTMQSDAPPVRATVPPPLSMRAAVLDAAGPASALRLATVDRPTPVLGEVLVHVIAAAVHPIDVRTRDGSAAAAAGIGAWPAVLGHDFSGVVVRAPYEAFRLRPGDEVYGVSAAPRCSGSFAEFVSVPAMQLALKPSVLSHAEAAAVPSAALIAWGAVVEVAKAHEGQRVLVLGGRHGAGGLATQLAAYFGAEVLDGTGGPLQDLDAVIVVDGRPEEDGWVDALRPGGLLVLAGRSASATLRRAADEHGVRLTGFEPVPDCATLAVVGRLITSGDLVAGTPDVVPFDRIADAHRLVESGGAAGEVVLQVTDW